MLLNLFFVESVLKLKKLDERLALLVTLALKKIKQVSKIDGFEGPDEVVKKILEKLGLEVKIKKTGCRSDILFGTSEGMTKYKMANSLKGKERIYQLGLAFGYPNCCSKYFSEFIMGEKKEKPKKLLPLEHFICPGCKKSNELLKKYKKEDN